MLPRQIWSFCIKGSAHKQIKGTRKMGCAGAPPPWLTPREYTDSSRVLHCRTWSFCVKGCRHKKTPKLGIAGASPLGKGAWLIPPENTPLSKRVILPNLVVLQVKRCECNEGYPSKKTDSSRITITQVHRNWHGSIGCVWLPINVPWAYLVLFRDKRRFQSKSQIFPTPVYLTLRWYFLR